MRLFSRRKKKHRDVMFLLKNINRTVDKNSDYILRNRRGIFDIEKTITNQNKELLSLIRYLISRIENLEDSLKNKDTFKTSKKFESKFTSLYTYNYEVERIKEGMVSTDPKLMTSFEVCDALKISRRHLYNLTKNGVFEVAKVNNINFYKLSDVASYISKNKNK